MRIVSPPLDQIEHLPTKLTQGEKKVLRMFDDLLPPKWEIYIQPHLNGLRPDFVLLNPEVGIAVFEVKDWDLKAMKYFDKGGRLYAVNQEGEEFSLEANNPIRKMELYAKEIFELYCPRLDQRAGKAAITSGLIFPCASKEEVAQAFDRFINQSKDLMKYEVTYPISAKEDVQSKNLKAIFPESVRQSSQLMSEEIAEDLRGWLREPYFSQAQRQPLELDQTQVKLSESKTQSGYRRIRGPSGSGKSLVLCARAANLAAEGKRVLVVCYNITLLNYLRDLTVRHHASRKTIRSNIEFLNFHNWCKRVVLGSGLANRYLGLWKRLDENLSREKRELLLDRIFKVEIPSLASTAVKQDGFEKYDAILVDEGQDLIPTWWGVLREALGHNGEMVLAADKTQDIYNTASTWTEEVMSNSGFRGPWSELDVSYRLPPKVIPIVCQFIRQFMQGHEIKVPRQPAQGELRDLYEVDLRWNQTTESNLFQACIDELRRMFGNLRDDTSFTDICILSDKNIGIPLVKHFSDKNISFSHTHSDDKQESQRLKRAFFQGSAKIKSTTLHSFKGWESRHLIVCVTSVDRPEDRALLYTALTRLQDHPKGSCLTVVSSCNDLIGYGQLWNDLQRSTT